MSKIYLIDGNSFIYRMFFALPEFSTKDGKIVNALFGMAKFFVGQLINENPDYIVFIKDAKGDNFRHKLYSEYKATRERMPDNLRSQIKDIEEMIAKMGIDIIEIDGFEADDVIGTLAIKLGENKENEVFILSGDKDLFALVTENVKIYDTMKKKIYGIEETKEKFEVEPKKITDYLAIIGDKSDNIPGIAGFGPKKAVALINNIGTVEEIYNFIEESQKDTINRISTGINNSNLEIEKLLKGKLLEKLIEAKEIAFLSKKLATLEKDVKLDNFKLENYKFNPKDILNPEIIEYFRKFEFYSLIGENEEKKDLKTWNDLGLKVKIITEKEELEKLEETISKYKKVVLDTETTSLDIMKAELVGVSIYLADQNIYYINRLHFGNKPDDIVLKNFFNNLLKKDILIIGHNLKYDLEILDLFLSGKNKSIENITNKNIQIGLF